jgi:hypothetical protein
MISIWVSGALIVLGLIVLWRLESAMVNSGKLPEVPPALVPRGCCWRGPVKASGSNSGRRARRRQSILPENYRLDVSDPS